jgi:CheY-like chemotaxis protein
MTKILVIEDDQPILDNLVDMLLMEDFEVLATDNGTEGIELAIKELPDIIFSDIMMPEVDGYYVFNSLKANPKTEKIPFVFLTAKADPVFIRQGLQLGASFYMTKPFSRQDLLKVIKDLQELHDF